MIPEKSQSDLTWSQGPARPQSVLQGHQVITSPRAVAILVQAFVVQELRVSLQVFAQTLTTSAKAFLCRSLSRRSPSYYVILRHADVTLQPYLSACCSPIGRESRFRIQLGVRHDKLQMSLPRHWKSRVPQRSNHAGHSGHPPAEAAGGSASPSRPYRLR